MLSYSPRLATRVIRRPRLEDWFDRFSGVAARCVVAPAGSGKTTAILGHLQNCENNGIYCSLSETATAHDVRGAIATAIGRPEAAASLGELARALSERAPLELALDCADAPTDEGRAEIARLVEALPEGVSLLIAARSRLALNVGSLVARGLATLCDFERLAFDDAEVRQLAEICDVAFQTTDVARLLEGSDGWPMAVSCAIRKAAEDDRDLNGSFEYWRSRQAHLFSDFITSALANASEADAALVRKLMAGGACDDDHQLRSLEAQGLFVVHGQHGYRPLRALSSVRRRGAATPAPARVEPMHVRMFGHLEVTVSGQPIEWTRRRDQQIFKYVVLKRNGQVTRAELAETFWPGAEKHLVAQSVRTACCNIRKAIAHAVGFDAVDRYVKTNGDIEINLDNVIVDVNRFVKHANDGDLQYDRGDLRTALAHYRAADELYSSDLLVGDAAELWFATQASMLEDRRVMVMERIAEIGEELHEYGTALHYARRVVELRPGNDAARAALAVAARNARLQNISTIEPPRLIPSPTGRLAAATTK
jgi:DNA-binding SARP family transcriptional activator